MKLAVELGRPNPNDLNLNVEWVQHAERLGVDIVHRDLTAARVHREVTSRGMIGAISAPVRLIPRRADG